MKSKEDHTDSLKEITQIRYLVAVAECVEYTTSSRFEERQVAEEYPAENFSEHASLTSNVFEKKVPYVM